MRFFNVFEAPTFCASSFLLAATPSWERRSPDEVGAASMGSSSSAEPNTAGRLRDGAGAAAEGFGLLSEKESFITLAESRVGRSFNGGRFFLVRSDAFKHQSNLAAKMALAGFDRRRINGPEESHAPVFEGGDDGEVEEGAGWVAGKARKTRDAMEIRPICVCVDGFWRLATISSVVTVLKPGLIDQANGSAYIETEKTKIACAVSVASFFFAWR